MFRNYDNIHPDVHINNIHEKFTLYCHINPQLLPQNRVIVKNKAGNDWDKSLEKLRATILRKFKASLSEMDQSQWTISINSKIIDKNDGHQFGLILSSIPPPVIIDIIPTTANIDYSEQCKMIIFHYNNMKIDYTLKLDQDEWNEETMDDINSAISRKFSLYSQFKIYEQVGKDKIYIDDAEDLRDVFDDDEKDDAEATVHLYVEADDNNNFVNKPRVKVHKDPDIYGNMPSFNRYEAKLIDDLEEFPANEAPMNNFNDSNGMTLWLRQNKLSHLQAKLGAFTVDTLFNLNATNALSPMLMGMAIKQKDIEQVKKALADDDISDDEKIEDDGRHPVLPLIIPNNCTYDAKRKKLVTDPKISRRSLKIYDHALQYIHDIRERIATVSIVGKARTGKSLAAGELYAPQKIPCPFDLGNLMDACTYGIWISARPIKHPTKDDMVVLIIDVEGTGAFDANKQHDMQLMVITLLISSYFIYNSKGAFDAPALDEIKFVLDLADNIKSSPHDDGQNFKKFFPAFMWLLRDVHLEPVINGKRVSPTEYFAEKVLKSDGKLGRVAMEREQVRSAFIQMFKNYTAFTLPIPHASKRVLSKLGTIARAKLQPKFNEELKNFRDIVLKQVECKILFSESDNGNDQYIECRGSHLAALIEKCVEAVNNPDKVPEMSSISQAIMADHLRKIKKKALKKYENEMENGLFQLRKFNKQQPLDESEINNLHINIVDSVLNGIGKALQPPKTFVNIEDEKESGDVDQQQFIVYKEFCHEIGHNTQIPEIGKTGILKSIKIFNSELSHKYCEKFVDEFYDKKIKPILDNSKDYDANAMSDKFQELEKKYFAQCKGPAKDECWKRFKAQRLDESLRNFKVLKGFSDEILAAQKDAAQLREKQRKMEEKYKQQGKDLAAQKQLLSQEIARVEKSAKEAQAKHQKVLQEQEQRLKNLHKAEFDKLKAAGVKDKQDLQKQLDKAQKDSKAALESMKQKMEKQVKQLKEQQAAKEKELKAAQIAIPSGYGYGYGGYGGMLRYTLRMSSQYYTGRYTFESLITDDGNYGAGTKNISGSYIEAYLGAFQHVSHAEVKGCAPNMAGGWHSGGCNAYQCVVQYRNTSGGWVQLKDFRSSRMPSNYITTLPINTTTDCVRIYGPSGYASCGTLRVFGPGGYYYGYYHGNMIPYTLTMSSRYPNLKNDYANLISDDGTMMAATNNSTYQYIQASFGCRHVSRIELKGGSGGGWSQVYARCFVQYLNTSGSWITLRDFTASGIPSGYITTIPVGTSASAVRVYGTATSTWIGIGTLRVFG